MVNVASTRVALCTDYVNLGDPPAARSAWRMRSRERTGHSPSRWTKGTNDSPRIGTHLTPTACAKPTR